MSVAVRLSAVTEWTCVLMNRQRYTCDVLIVGGGPAGIAAAVAASEYHQRVIIVDDNPAPGGQIWRGSHTKSSPAAHWIDQLKSVQVIIGTRVFYSNGGGQLYAESDDDIYEIQYQRLILATGARERFIPFPGWTLPGVMGAGGLQALVKGGYSIRGKRVVVAGTGPLLLAVAAYLKEKGADIRLIAEQAPFPKLANFGFQLVRQPTKIWQFMGLQKQLLGIPYLRSSWPIAAEGKAKLESVTLQQNNRKRQVECDYLACSFYLVPNLELPTMLGCTVTNGVVQVNEFQETSQPNIYAVGEITGIGGLEKSLVEGQIAGYAASAKPELARKLFRERAKQYEFAGHLARTFELRVDLKNLVTPETIVCRCEDVTRQRLDSYASWRAAKLQTRCGMGPCQGRICGPAVSFLYNWQVESIRPPLFPVKVDSLISLFARQADQ